MPSGSAAEALVRDALPVTAHVVDPARERERSEKSARGIGDIDCGAKRRQRPVVAGAATIEQPQPKHDAASTGAGEPLRLLLGGKCGSQDRRTLADRRLLGHPSVLGVDERDGRLEVDLYAGGDRRVDDDPRSVRAKPIVLAPRVGMSEQLERT